MNERVTDQRCYRVVVSGRLGDLLAGTFDQLEVESRPGETSLTGSFADQAQLHGLLDRLRDLGITLVSVNPVDQQPGLAPPRTWSSHDSRSIRSQARKATTSGSTRETPD